METKLNGFFTVRHLVAEAQTAVRLLLPSELARHAVIPRVADPAWWRMRGWSAK